MSKLPPQPPGKRGLSLDFNSSPKKRTRLTAANGQPSSVLTTPDVQMLKMSSPELAKFLNASSQGLPTPTPSTYFPKNVTEEQALYAKGFEDALKKVKQKETVPAVAAAPAAPVVVAHKSSVNNLVMAANAIASQPPLPVSVPASAAVSSSRPSSGASGSVDSNDSYALPEGVRVKQEAADDDLDDEDFDDDDSSSLGGLGVSPIDMDDQERIKLERKRARNRLAASKCRKRKLERIAQLDDKVRALKGENGELSAMVRKLRESVCGLKQEVMDHVNGGCQIMMSEHAAM